MSTLWLTLEYIGIHATKIHDHWPTISSNPEGVTIKSRYQQLLLFQKTNLWRKVGSEGYIKSMHVSMQIFKLVPANLPRVLIIWSKEFLFWRHLVYFSIVPSCKYSSSSRRCVYCRRSLKGEVCITRSDFSQSRLSPSLEPGELAGQKESSSSRFSLLLIHIHPTTCHTQNFRQYNFFYRKKCTLFR